MSTKPLPNDSINVLAGYSLKHGCLSAGYPVECSDCHTKLVISAPTKAQAERDSAADGLPIKYICHACLQTYYYPVVAIRLPDRDRKIEQAQNN